MYFDSGRLADLKNLEKMAKQAPSQTERQKYLSLIDKLKRQAQDSRLNKEREYLMEARRQGDRQVADKLEEKIAKEHNQVDN